MVGTIDGIVSGLSTSAVVDALVNAEGATQRALKARQDTAKKQAAAYRTLNTRFDALKSAAETFMKPSTWSASKTTSTAPSVSATTTGVPVAGSLTFSVLATAASHSLVSAGTWGSTADPSGFGSSIELFNSDGSSRGVVEVGGSQSLADTVSALNKSTLGVTAAAVQVAPGQYRLQVSSSKPGETAAFSMGNPGDFNVATQGADAKLRVGTGPGAYEVRSSSNAFAGLMPGVTLNVTKPETDVTIEVKPDPEAVEKSVAALVEAANVALGEIKKSGNNSPGSTATLRGDINLTRLTGQVLGAISGLVGGKDSPGLSGIELTRDGSVKFNKEKFNAAYKDDPAKVQAVLSGTPAVPGADGTLTAPDAVAAVPGVADRLREVAKTTTDKSTGSLTLLAQGRDKSADDITKRIAEWDRRLEAKRTSLMRQFTAMEVALGGMQSQSSWLASQIKSL